MPSHTLLDDVDESDPIDDEMIEPRPSSGTEADWLAVGGSRGLFLLRTANRWMVNASRRPTPRKLFGDFWFEGELCFLFADTNTGKSILAVQIADSISRGFAIPGFALEATRQPVLYFDFELSDKQFEARYADDYQHHYRFDDGFLRAEFDTDYDGAQNASELEAYLAASLEHVIAESGAKIIIVDNLTYLRNETERAAGALPLMKHLKALKKQHGLSLLMLAHTPKRDLSKPLTRNDLQGSKMLINFCDSAFAIGESRQDKTLRYLKQIKARNTSIIYDGENVCVCQMGKVGNFLRFEFLGYGSEPAHLRVPEEWRSERREQIKRLAQEGKSQREIASELGIAVGTVNYHLHR